MPFSDKRLKTAMNLVYNSDMLAHDAFGLTAGDRAFQYGDGLFETIRYEAGRLWFWPDHAERLWAGMNALDLQLPGGQTPDGLYERIGQLIATNHPEGGPVRIKLQVWRQPGGLYTPATSAANLLITTAPGQPFTVTNKSKIGIYDAYRLYSSPVSAYKTLNALPYVLAGRYKVQHGFEDVLLLDTDSCLAECLASNLFWFRNGVLHTPALSTGCVNGIARRQLVRLFPGQQEGHFRFDALATADVVFAANVMGIQLFSGALTPAQRNRIRRQFIPIVPRRRKTPTQT